MLEVPGLLDYLLRRVEMLVHLGKLLLLHRAKLILSLLGHFESLDFPESLMVEAVGVGLGQ